VALASMRDRAHDSPQDYENHYKVIVQLLAKAPNSRPLLALGAEVAMKAEKPDQALNYLNRTRALLDKDDAQIYRRQYNNIILQRQRILSSCALPFVDRLHAGESVEKVFAEALAKHKALLNIAEFAEKRKVLVAVIGGVPHR